MGYLEAAGVAVDVEVLDGDLGIITHLLSAEVTGGRRQAAGETQRLRQGTLAAAQAAHTQPQHSLQE